MPGTPMTRLLALCVLAAGLAGLAATLFIRTPPQADGPSMILQADAEEIDTSIVQEMALGAEDAPMEVIEYASFTCIHCATFHRDVFPQIKENYVDTGQVRFVYREVYFGQDPRPSLWPGLVARCDDGSRYFGIVDMVYDRRDDWLSQDTAQGMVDALRRIGRTAGLSDEQLDACFSDAEMAQAMYAKWLEHQAEDNIDATPSFVIDGRKYSNMSYADFAAILDDKLAE
jgi:protein-disulfide isomerase